MTPDGCVERLLDLGRRQYGPLLDRLSVSTEFQAALREVSWPADEAAAAALAGDMIRRGLLSLAERLLGALGTLREWTTYHRAGADLPEPTRTAWLLGEYLGLGAADYQRLTGKDAATFEGVLQEAEQRVHEALATPQPRIDEERLQQELQAIGESTWSPEFGVIPPAMIALVRDAAQVRMFGCEAPDPPTRRAFYLAFARQYREFRQGNCHGILGGSYDLAERWEAAAREELARVQDSIDARPELIKTEQLASAEECFALMHDAGLNPVAIAELLGTTSADVKAKVNQYEDAIRQWIAGGRKKTDGA